jgi:L-fuculose-phosphate aldolase
MEGWAIKATIVEACRRLHARGLITATEGNVTVREGDVLFVTPGGVGKGTLNPADIVRTDLDGRPLEPGPPISSETPMHVHVYRRRADVRAIVHAHPPLASAFAAAHQRLDSAVLAEGVLLLGRIPLVPYLAPSTEKLAAAVAEAALGADGLLLANHGAVTLAGTLERALVRMETLEHLARTTFLARLLGGERTLRPADIEELLALRQGGLYGEPPRR